MIRNGFVATLAAWAALGATGAAAQNVTKQAVRAATCVTEPEARALALAMSPSVLRQVADICARTLPPTAFLRASGREMLGRYDAAGAAAMPAAGAALGRIMGPQAQALADSGMLGPMMVGMIGPVIASDVKPESCPAVDRVLADLAPLPPANAAGLFVTILQLVAADHKAKGKSFPIEFCPAATQ